MSFADQGWIEPAADRVEQLRKLLDFFCIASPAGFGRIEETHGILFRRSVKLKSDPFALAAWLRRGEIEAAQIDTKNFDLERFRSALSQARGLTRSPPASFHQELRRICADAGVVVLFVPELPKACVSGAARWVSHRPVIQLSIRHKTDDHLWFTFFHEAAHILLHGRQEVFIDEERCEGEALGAKEETEANESAAERLVPVVKLQRFLDERRYPYAQGYRISKKAIADFADKIGIAPGIVVGQLQHKGCIPYQNCNELKIRLRWVQRDGTVVIEQRPRPDGRKRSMWGH